MPRENITRLVARTRLKTKNGRTILTFATAPTMRGMRLYRGGGASGSTYGLQTAPAAPPPPPPPAPAPTLASLSPDSSGNWNQEVVVTGTNFTNQSVVLANNVPVQQTNYDSPTQLRAVAPASAAGTYQIKVRNIDGQTSNSLPFTAF